MSRRADVPPHLKHPRVSGEGKFPESIISGRNTSFIVFMSVKLYSVFIWSHSTCADGRE